MGKTDPVLPGRGKALDFCTPAREDVNPAAITESGRWGTSVFFTVHFILLYVSGRTDALTAGVLNGLSLFRNGLLLFTEKKRTTAGTALIAGFFSAAVIVFGILTWNSWVSVLFITAMVLVTVSMSVRKPNSLRLLMMVAAPFAFAYDLLIGSIGGSINEAVSFASVLIAFVRNRDR